MCQPKPHIKDPKLHEVRILIVKNMTTGMNYHTQMTRVATYVYYVRDWANDAQPLIAGRRTQQFALAVEQTHGPSIY